VTILKILGNRISIIEKDKPIYFSQTEQQKFGVKFIFYTSLIFLLLGITIALLSSMHALGFDVRWTNSGLFYLCTLSFQLKVFGYGKYIVLEKHKTYLKRVLNQSSNSKVILPDSYNAEFESALKSKTIIIMNALLIALSLMGGICFLENLDIWMHFDLAVFFVWSMYGLFCFHKIHLIKQAISTFKLQIKPSI